MRPSRKYEAHSRLQQGFGGKGREVQKVRATDEIDDTNGYDPPPPPPLWEVTFLHYRMSGSDKEFFISSVHSCRKHANISDHRTFQLCQKACLIELSLSLYMYI